MRDYNHPLALLREASETFPHFRQIVRTWLTRRHLREIDCLEDHTLFDIGVSRGDIAAVRALPADRDALQELYRRRAVTARTAPKS